MLCIAAVVVIALANIRYWLEQIQAILGNNDKPIVVVGTHADEVVKTKQDPNNVLQDLINQLSKNPNLVSSDIKAFIAVSMATGVGLTELKSCLVDLALSHPQIGISTVSVSRPIVAIQERVQLLVHQNRWLEREQNSSAKYYMEWSEFEVLCTTKDILTWSLWFEGTFALKVKVHSLI